MGRILIGNIKGPQGNTGVRGSQWFYGTGITGTGTTATVFEGSGVSYALVGDYYLSTAGAALGNVYRCTVEGEASAAKWVYIGNIRGAQGATGATGPTGPMPALINNALTTVAGEAALDAAMGKIFQDQIDALNGNLSPVSVTAEIIDSDICNQTALVIRKYGRIVTINGRIQIRSLTSTAVTLLNIPDPARPQAGFRFAWWDQSSTGYAGDGEFLTDGSMSFRAQNTSDTGTAGKWICISFTYLSKA